MTETRQQAYENAAGLLRRMGYEARVDPAHRVRGSGSPVTALISCAPELVIGYAVAITAAEPEAHLPANRARAGRVPKGQSGDPPWAYWLDNKK